MVALLTAILAVAVALPIAVFAVSFWSRLGAAGRVAVVLTAALGYLVYDAVTSSDDDQAAQQDSDDADNSDNRENSTGDHDDEPVEVQVP